MHRLTGYRMKMGSGDYFIRWKPVSWSGLPFYYKDLVSIRSLKNNQLVKKSIEFSMLSFRSELAHTQFETMDAHSHRIPSILFDG